MTWANGTPRPAQFCKALLAALDASEGRKRRRKRDQTPDNIGLSVKREILERVVQENPTSEELEGWLLRYVRHHEDRQVSGAVLAMARAVLEEWRLVHTMSDFATWLQCGAFSEDTDGVQRSR